MNFRMATNQAGTLIMQGTVNPPINQNQQPVVGGQTNPQKSPVITLKIFGGIQIVCGILLGILSIIGVALDAKGMNESCKSSYIYDYDYDFFNIDSKSYKMCLNKQSNGRLLFTFDVTCIVCSGWVSYEMSMILNSLGN